MTLLAAVSQLASLALMWRIYRAGAEDPATLKKAGNQSAS